jgi:hypothetical protein
MLGDGAAVSMNGDYLWVGGVRRRQEWLREEKEIGEPVGLDDSRCIIRHLKYDRPSHDLCIGAVSIRAE